MNDDSQTAELGSEEAARVYAQELINILAKECPTAEAFIGSLARVRCALLEALDAVEPEQVVEETRRNAMPEEIRRRVTEESEQRRKERGSLQDPLYPPAIRNHWD